MNYCYLIEENNCQFVVPKLTNDLFYFGFQMFVHFVLMLKGWRSLSSG